MRRYSQRQSLSTLSEINITPLLDLAFVLLIIFMITTPLLESTMNLVIPSSGATNPPIKSAQVQILSIDRSETIRFNNQVIDLKVLTADGIETNESRGRRRDSTGSGVARAKTDCADGRAETGANYEGWHRYKVRVEIDVEEPAFA
jgi:biopolymer transport protein ExbD